MTFDHLITLAMLHREVTHYRSCRTRDGRTRSDAARSLLPFDSEVFLHAIEMRMNANPVLASFSPARPDADPAMAFGTWLDDGAPGLAEAAVECEQEDHLTFVKPGDPPGLTAMTADAFVGALRAMLTTSITFYDITIVDADVVLDGFLRAEFPGGLSPCRFFDVDLGALEARTDYFDSMGNDRCLLWSSPHQMRVLFVNGSD